MPTRTDPVLLRAAIAASGLSARGFAIAVLGVNERTVRRWLSGERELQGTARVVCAAIVDDPALTLRLSRSIQRRMTREGGPESRVIVSKRPG